MRKLILFLLPVILAACALPGGSRPTGTLEGKVTVGPLTPMMRVDQPTATPPPQVFTSRGLAIYKSDGKTLVKRLAFSPDGSYRVDLPEGAYVVDLDHEKNPIEHAGGLPAQVTIKAGQVTRLDVDIDTGIR